MRDAHKVTCNYFSIAKNDNKSQMSLDSHGLPFYKLLEHLEQSKNWSEKDVLCRLCVPRTTYRSWRDGTSEPSKRIYWIKLAEAFEVPLEALIRMDLNLLQVRRF